MTTQQFFLSAWHWDVIGIAVCALALGYATCNLKRRRQGFRLTGVLLLWLAILVVALLSPVGTLARSYLFSAHMFQHLLLLMVVPPLFLLTLPRRGSKADCEGVWLTRTRTVSGEGAISSSSPQPSDPGPDLSGLGRGGIVGRVFANLRPSRFARHSNRMAVEPEASPPLRSAAATRFERLLTFPPATWLAGVGAMWFWHVPLFCNAATSTPGVYALQALSLLFLGALFWWPIAGPRADQHLSPLAGIAYLVSACFACTLLGIYITFAPISVCSVYMHPVDRLGILPLIQNQWGLTPETDQHIGGLLMWVPACLIYLSGVVGLLARWYAGSEAAVPGGTRTLPSFPESHWPTRRIKEKG